jgi:hypothetical protein
MVPLAFLALPGCFGFPGRPQHLAGCHTGARRNQEEPGGASARSQEEPGEARRSQQEPVRARRSQAKLKSNSNPLDSLSLPGLAGFLGWPQHSFQLSHKSHKEPGGARNSHGEPGRTRSTQEGLGGPQNTQGEPGGTKNSQEQGLASAGLS